MLVDFRYYCFVNVVCCALDYVWMRGVESSADVGFYGECRDVHGLCRNRRVRELGAALCL